MAEVTAERALVGCLLNAPGTWPVVQSYSLKSGDWYDADLFAAYVAMKEMFLGNEPVDIVSIMAKAPSLDAAMLSDCMDIATQAGTGREYAASYCEAMIGSAVKRRAARLLDNVDDMSAEKILERLQHFVDEHSRFRRGTVNTWDQDVSSVVDDVVQKKYLDGLLKTGIDDLDRLLVGLRRGSVYILAARPGMGKTTLAVNMATSIAQGGDNVGIISLEMTRYELILKLLSSLSGVNQYGLQTGVIPRERMPDLQKAEEDLKKTPLHIVDDCASNWGGVYGAMYNLVHERGCRVIIIDYLQLMRGDGRHQHREQEVASISRRIKESARELNIPIVPLSQLSRKTEGRSDKRPELADLRESGSLEQDADAVMFLYREGYYDQAAGHDETELILAKNRHGAPGIVPLAFDAARSRFRPAR